MKVFNKNKEKLLILTILTMRNCRLNRSNKNSVYLHYVRWFRPPKLHKNVLMRGFLPCIEGTGILVSLCKATVIWMAEFFVFSWCLYNFHIATYRCFCKKWSMRIGKTTSLRIRFFMLLKSDSTGALYAGTRPYPKLSLLLDDHSGSHSICSISQLANRGK